MYLFSSGGIWTIDTKTILTNVRRIDSVSGFDGAKWKGLDKILHG